MRGQRTISSNLMTSLWENSFIYKIFSHLGKVFIRSLNNSIIISKLLDDKRICEKDGNLIKIVDKIKINLINLFKWIKNLFSNAFMESYLVNMLKDLKFQVVSDVCRFILITFGTGLFSCGILSFTKGAYSIKRTLFFIVLGILPLIIGFLNIEVNTVFMESRFIKLIKKIFEYDS
jgi:hypothetical protein